MSIISEVSGGAAAGASANLDFLKKFQTAGRGFWHDVSDADWNDWHWQLKHRIVSLEQLQRFMPTLTPEEQLEIFGTTKVTGEWADEAQQRWGDTEAWARSQRRTAAGSRCARSAFIGKSVCGRLTVSL